MDVSGTASLGRACLTSQHLRYPLTGCSASVTYADDTLTVPPSASPWPAPDPLSAAAPAPPATSKTLFGLP